MSTIMARGTTGFRMGHGVPFHHNTKRDGCSSGGFYKSPSAGQTVQAGNPVNITWDTSCMSAKAVDVYLYAPVASNPRIHMWENVNFALGCFQTTLHPQWWNSTSSVNLQLAIVPSGTPPFMATMPAGPMFQATYSNTSSSAVQDPAVGGAIEQVNNFPAQASLSKGKVASAVLLPIIIVCALIGAVYIKMSRAKGRDDRKRWSEAVDKRMSTISTDWKSISAAGASAAIRNSMAVGEAGNRASSFSFGVIRPASSAPTEDGGQAGIGSGGFSGKGIDTTTPQMSQLRPGLRTANTGERVSRISFAADTRPSGESRRTLYRDSRASRTSRAFHTGHVPPLPERQNTAESGELSPTQTNGPLTLTVEDIQARMSGQETTRPSVDEVFPALTMMRTGEAGQSKDDLLIKPQTPLPPLPALPPAAQIPKTSIVGIMPMQPMPGNMMSPDDMLRAYAERRAVTSPPPTGNGPTVPIPAANYNGNGMRVLYSPSTPDSGSSVTVVAGVPESADSHYSNLNRKSAAMTVGSRYDDDDAYVGTAE